MENQSGNISVFDGYIGRYLDAQERIQKLFGVANMDEFLKMDEAALTANFMKLQEQASHSPTPSAANPDSNTNERPESISAAEEKVDYAALDKALKESSVAEASDCESVHGDSPAKNPPKGGIALTLRVSQEEATMWSPGWKKGTTVLNAYPCRTHISEFFKNFANKIDPEKKLLGFYKQGALYFNALDIGAGCNIEECAKLYSSLYLSNDSIQEMARSVYNKIDTLYNIWHLPTETTEVPLSEEESRRRQSIKVSISNYKKSHQEESNQNTAVENDISPKEIPIPTTGKKYNPQFRKTVSRTEFYKTVSIMIELLPLNSGNSSIKSQKTYDDEKESIRQIFKKYLESADTICFPAICIEGSASKVLFNEELPPKNVAQSKEAQKLGKNLHEAICFLDKFPNAKKDLQSYLNNWNLNAFFILVCGVKEFARELCEQLESVKTQILHDMDAEGIDKSKLKPDILEKAAICMIDNRCVYTYLLGECFGLASGSVPGKRFTKGSILYPNPVPIAPAKKKRKRKKN